MQMNTAVFRRIMDEHEAYAINEMVTLMRQTPRFSTFPMTELVAIATLAWNGQVDLDKA